jgi:GTPase SAR1 family protein
LFLFSYHVFVFPKRYGGGGLPPDKVVTTVGCNVARLAMTRCKLLLWDLGGRVSLRVIWEKYYADSKAVIYCIDCADPVHWEESKCVLAEVMKAKAKQKEKNK